MGSLGRSWRWCQRYRVVAGLAAAVSLLLMVGSGWSLVLALRETGEANQALQAKDKVEESRDGTVKVWDAQTAEALPPAKR